MKTSQALAAGTTFLIRQPVMGKIRDQTVRVIAADPNRRIEMEAAFGPVRPRISLTFEATAGRAHVTFERQSRPVGAFRLVRFLMNRVGQRNWKRRLRLIKGALGAEGARPTERQPPTR